VVREIDPVAVVQAIADRVGDRAFTVAELAEHCAADPVLAEALGDLALKPRRLGKLLRKAAGVERIGTEGGAAIWRISGVLQTTTGHF
jgi:hypothetical protein